MTWGGGAGYLSGIVPAIIVLINPAIQVTDPGGWSERASERELGFECWCGGVAVDELARACWLASTLLRRGPFLSQRVAIVVAPCCHRCCSKLPSLSQHVALVVAASCPRRQRVAGGSIDSLLTAVPLTPCSSTHARSSRLTGGCMISGSNSYMIRYNLRL